jgi:KRAB domain-containing zinc finger protein
MFKYKSNLKKHLKEGRCKGKSEGADTLAEEEAEIARKQLIEITKNYCRSIFKEHEVVEVKTQKAPCNVQYTDPLKSTEIDGVKKISNRMYTKRKTTRIVRLPSTAPYACDICGFTTVKKCDMLSHIRHHISVNKHKCINCSETFRSRELLHRHSMKVHNRGVIGSIEYSKSSIKCEYCGKKFSAERIQAHLSLHVNPKIVCDSCGDLFRTRQGLERHIASKHQSERKFTCAACGKSFKKLQILKTHEETHNPIKIYVKCEMCCTMLQMKYLKNHMEIRHGNRYREKRLTCGECGKAFRYQKQLDKHIDQVHESKSRGIFYSCGECERVFNRRRDLRNHSFVHYSGPVFECMQCGLKFKRKKLLYIHVRVHNPESRYPCKQCSSVFQTHGGRRKHMMKVHDTMMEDVIEIPLI